MAVDLRPPGGAVSLWAVLFLLLGPFIVLVSVVSGNPIGLVAGIVFLALGAGLWLRQTWARWLGLAVALFMAGWVLIGMSSNGVKLGPASILLASVGLAAEMWDWRVRGSRAADTLGDASADDVAKSAASSEPPESAETALEQNSAETTSGQTSSTSSA